MSKDTDPHPGFRLKLLEFWNWGTFDSSTGQVHRIRPDGESTLLIGRNGSGKSTLIDALLSLLTPPQQRNYNVAAGSSGKKERSEKTYIQGAYGHTSTSDSHRSQTQFLRPGNLSYSVILGVFENSSTGESFTLAQFLHLDGQLQTKRYFCYMDGSGSIEAQFSGITSMEKLKARFEKSGLKVTMTYTDYGRFLRKRTGMEEKAMDVFNQAVAVKEIDSLDEFIRSHMLKKRRWKDIVDKVLAHFEQLSAAHAALVKTRREAELLEPVHTTGKAWRTALANFEKAVAIRQAVAPYIAQVTLDLLRPECESLTRELAALEDRKEVLTTQHSSTSDDVADLKASIKGSGSERLHELEKKIPLAEITFQQRKTAATKLSHSLSRLELPQLCQGEPAFQSILKTAASQLARSIRSHRDLENRSHELAILFDKQGNEIDDLKTELTALKKRRTQLPEAFQSIRARMTSALGLQANDLPFAAELMAVKKEELAWEESIEKVLRTFGLTLLVAPDKYEIVSRFIDSTHLKDERGRGMRLNYERLDEDIFPTSEKPAEPDSLVSKIEFREHPLGSWLRQRLTERFDYRCCENITEFQNARGKAMTRSRHLRHNFSRHEKDDSQRATDPRNFVLGWDNQRKITYLTAQLNKLQSDLENLKSEQAKVSSDKRRLDEEIRLLEELGKTNYSELDHWTLGSDLTEMKAEREQLISSDDTLRILKESLATAETRLETLNRQRDEVVGEISIKNKQLEDGQKMLDRAESNLADLTEETATHFPTLQKHFPTPVSIAGLQPLDTEATAWAAEELRRTLEKREQKARRVVEEMGGYLREMHDQHHLAASVESLDDFLSRRRRIIVEDLPRHEERFKKHLNEKVTQEIAILNTRFRDAGKDIEKRIRQLNQSLTSISDDSGTHMKLEIIPTKDREISDFRQQLLSCLDGGFGAGDVADEERYKVIAAFIKRLKEEDRWRDRVIDVRRWFHFAVGEYDATSGEQTSYYTDSAGQSGGEKARLAFTILVAAIAYQYNIDPAARESSRFHFVMVDEMFSKVDDKYAEYALRLFRRFGLQLLIVAPFDAKARVCDPFVGHYLHVIKTEDRSQVYAMTSEEIPSD